MDDGVLDIIKKYLRRFRRERNIKNYYIKKIKNGKSYTAVLLDGLFTKTILTIIFLFYIYAKTFNFFFSLILSLSFFISSLIISYRIKYKKLNDKIKQINGDLSKKRIIKEISSFTNAEFVLYVKEVLEKYYNISVVEYEEKIDLVGEIHGEIYGIKCIRIPQDERITTREIKEFKNDIMSLGIKKGIFATNSYFIEGLKDEENDHIKLVDFDFLIKMIKEVKMYPSRDEIEEIIINRQQENKKKLSKIRGNIFSTDKIFKYFILGFCLYLLSRIVDYEMYYKIISLVLFILGSVSLFYGFFYKTLFRKDDNLNLQK